MKQKSLKVNAIWNLLYTGSNILFPLITAPYVTRTLGASNLGEVDFAKSFVQWFVIFATFGITSYGVRAISQVRDQKSKLDKVFSELFTINLTFSVLATIIYFIFIFNSDNFASELPLFIVMSFSIILNAVNIDWFYQGIEEYNYITIRNFIIKIVSLFLIFIFIKEPSDYVLYGLISVLGVSLSGILNVINSRKYAKFTFKDIQVIKHIKMLKTFFLITFVISIYTNLDRTLLGFIDTSTSVAFLTRAKMITTMAGSVSTSIASVAMPRASYYLKENFSKYKRLIQEVPKYMLILTIPMTVGIISLSPEIMFILGGEEFMKSSNLLAFIAIVAVFVSLSTFLQQQVLVPSGNERYGLVASIASSIVSLVANVLLIPRYSYMGAGLALVLAEFTAVSTRYIFTKKIGFNFVNFINVSSIKYVIASLIMIVPIYILKQNVSSDIGSFGLSVTVGGLTYFVFLFLLKEDLVIRHSKDILNKVRNK